MAAFSPVHTVGRPDRRGDPAARLAGDPTGSSRRSEARAITVGLFRDVGISMPEQRIDAYSWQLSGGLRQRAMIAMALSCKPRLLIADEPTTAIDVTTQAQVLALLRDLQRKYDTAIIFITHDLGVIAQMASYVVVMYLGRVMEEGRSTTSSMRPSIPTRGPCCARSRASTARRACALPIISGALPHPFNRPPRLPVPSALPRRHGRRLPTRRAGAASGRRPPAASCFLHHDEADRHDAPRPRRSQPLLDVRGLRKFFPITRGFLRRVVARCARSTT